MSKTYKVIVSDDGTKGWYLNDELHREDGPAIECADGTKFWYLNGDYVSEDEFLERTRRTCNGKIVEIDGKKYKLTEVKS